MGGVAVTETRFCPKHSKGQSTNNINKYFFILIKTWD